MSQHCPLSAFHIWQKSLLSLPSHPILPPPGIYVEGCFFIIIVISHSKFSFCPDLYSKYLLTCPVAFYAHPCIPSRQLHLCCLMGCQKHNKAMTVHCIETLREKSIIKACLTSMYNIVRQQNALDAQEILYWDHLKGEIMDFLIFKIILGCLFLGFFKFFLFLLGFFLFCFVLHSCFLVLSSLF